MKQLFEIDLKDYSPDSKVFSRPSARAVIMRGGKIALVYSQKEKYFKFPGGGINGAENHKAALIREVREEVGLVVKPDSIKEFGSVLRRQKNNRLPDTIFEQENFYYFCEVEEKIVNQNLDLYEADAGFVLKFVDIDEAIQVNAEYKSDDFFNEIMIKRELKVLQLLKNC